LFFFSGCLFSCGTFQNLREVVWETQVLVLAALPRKKPFFIRRGTNYLIRYFFLLLINAYLCSEVKYDFKRVTFEQWLAQRPEIGNILADKLTYPELLADKSNRETNQ